MPTYRCLASFFRLGFACYVVTSHSLKAHGGYLVQHSFMLRLSLDKLLDPSPACSAGLVTHCYLCQVNRTRVQLVAVLLYARSIVIRVVANAFIAKLTLLSWCDTEARFMRLDGNGG